MVLMGYSGVWGKLIHEKNFKLKVSCQTPFKFKFSFEPKILTMRNSDYVETKQNGDKTIFIFLLF